METAKCAVLESSRRSATNPCLVVLAGERMPFIWDQLTYLQILCSSENGDEIVHVQHTELQRYLWKRTKLELNFSETGCTVHILREVPHHSYLYLQWTSADLTLVNYA